jgi:hypothetical protein
MYNELMLLSFFRLLPSLGHRSLSATISSESSGSRDDRLTRRTKHACQARDAQASLGFMYTSCIRIRGPGAPCDTDTGTSVLIRYASTIQGSSEPALLRRPRAGSRSPPSSLDKLCNVTINDAREGRVHPGKLSLSRAPSSLLLRPGLLHIIEAQGPCFHTYLGESKTTRRIAVEMTATVLATV